ncbi:MAG TPA: DUF998 domain-containing protein [Solirubrobacteraceae bacterium]|nr:DUF998 domain-containing protein [Solirubrobacteraceae bacterium]
MTGNALSDVAAWLRPAGWPALADASRERVRALAWFAICAQVLFIAGWIVGWLLEPGYSPVRMYISELGRRGAAHPWIFDASIVVWGIGFIALAMALLPALRTRPWARVAPSLFALAGIFAMLDAPLSLDCADSVSRACKARQAAGALSWHHYGHLWASLGIQIALVLTPFALARATWPSRLARLMLIGGVLVALLLGVAFLADFDQNGSAGLGQRVQVLVVHGWVLLCAAALIVESRPGST